MESPNRIRIGGTEKVLEEVEAQWVHQTIRGLERDERLVCVEILAKTERLNVRFSTACCRGGSGGGRCPNAEEAEIMGHWEAMGLGSDCPELSRLWPFVERLRSYLKHH